MTERGDFDIDWSAISRGHERLDADFRRLLADSPHSVNVGDRVVVAIGLIDRGHPWVRDGGTVKEVGTSSVRVLLDRRGLRGAPDEVWVHRALITDVLAREERT